MKQMLKSYHVFLPLVWERTIVYLLYPVLLLMLNYFGRVKLHIDAEAYLMLCAGMVVAAELFLDYFIFGGIAAKDTNKLEYLKTSTKGISLLKKGLVGDWIRRFISVGIIIMANYCLGEGALSLGKTGVCVFSTLLLAEAGLIVTRFFSLMTIVTAMIIFLGMLAMVITLSVLAGGMVIWICPVLCVVVSVLGRMLIIRKMKGSYYDGRD